MASMSGLKTQNAARLWSLKRALTLAAGTFHEGRFHNLPPQNTLTKCGTEEGSLFQHMVTRASLLGFRSISIGSL